MDPQCHVPFSYTGAALAGYPGAAAAIASLRPLSDSCSIGNRLKISIMAERRTSQAESETEGAAAAPPQLKIATRFAGVLSNLDVSERVVIFTHVPKTGGTTLDHIITAVAAATGKRKRRLRRPSTGPGVVPAPGQHLVNFEDLPEGLLADADYLTGHFQFGIHRRLQRPFLYVTLLRDPIQRLLSNIRFGIDRGNWSRDTPIESIFAAGRLIDNIQTRQLAGVADRSTPCTAEMLAAARDNLRRHYAVAGLTERFDETLRTLITLLGWPDIAYTDRQVSATTVDPELESRARLAAERFSPLDMELYADVAAMPVPWAYGIIEGTPTGAARQQNVLVTSPLFQLNNRPLSLLPYPIFDLHIRPLVARRGGEVVFV